MPLINQCFLKPRLPANIILAEGMGFEPMTHSLEGCCSIQLSYRTIFFKSVAKVRQFIENSNNLPKFFIRKSIFPSFRL